MSMTDFGKEIIAKKSVGMYRKLCTMGKMKISENYACNIAKDIIF